MWQFIQMFFLFLAGHSLADTALQKRSMGGGKNRHNPVDLKRVPKGQQPLNLWYMFLIHHSLIHGLIVFFIAFVITFDISLSINLGILESMSHCIIDFYKCENKYGPIIDQLLHIIMKILYIGIILLQ